MILLDISQICISNLMKSPEIRKSGEIDDNLIKHMILNSIRAYKTKFKAEYGEIVCCCDSRHYWRKDVFPHYKANRKKDREDSVFNWDQIFKTINQMKIDLKECFPYRVIQVEGAEADDVVAVLAKHSAENNQKTIIIGSDGDYYQLLKHDKIKQWSPLKKKLIEIADPVISLKEKIITGDPGDGVPNIKSDSNSFVIGKRQTSVYKKDMDKWVHMQPEEFCTSRAMLENYQRNKQLIDFDMIPNEITEKIIEEYEKPLVGNKTKMMDYFIINKMRNLMKDADEF